ncbi:trypsinogen-like protein 3 [Brachionichthys hirsutus]|uniref:trypsinogen-like protein 3 n=1 Tax=Brachionichthys hirsutus TaxID=412623 RepID=UPI0036046B73
MHLLLLAFSVGLVGAFPLEDDKACRPHTRPWQVHLHGGGVSCSGALINEWWIVTSFACAPTAFQTVASLGDHDVTVQEGTEQHITVADVIRHGPYRSPLHSLTMVRLASPARFTPYVKPVPLPSRCPQPGDACQVSGWGSTIANQYEPARQLKCITVPIVDDMTCMNTFPDYIYWSMGMVCAGQGDTDNCLHDGSGVMVCNGQLQGVQWFAHGCRNPAHPSVYTKLCLYNDWINGVMDRYAPLASTLPTTTK